MLLRGPGLDLEDEGNIFNIIICAFSLPVSDTRWMLSDEQDY